MVDMQTEIAGAAARLIVDDGLDYGPAKRRAVQALGLPARTPLPDNDLVEAAVREHLALFYAETQPQELAALRRLALGWMERLAEFRPHLTGAVWRGTATRRHDVFIQLFCDDPKSAEMTLIDQRLDYQPQTVTGFRGEPVEALSLSVPCQALSEMIGVHLMVYDHDDLRGALKPDRAGRTARGSLDALRALLASDEAGGAV